MATRPTASPTSASAARDATPSPSRLRHLFETSGLRLSDLQVQQFWTFHQLLRRRNEELDLTRLHAFDTIVLKHYVDCALVATLVDLPSPLLDLGSGAGFPGIPLKIVRPDVHVLLGEPRHKRVAFLEEAIQALGLRDIEVVPHRIGPRFERTVRGVVTRAVEPIPATLARIEAWLEPGARVLFMKGPGVAAEVVAARQEWSEVFRITRDVPYTIQGTPHSRRLVVLERLPGAGARARPGDATDGEEPATGEASARGLRRGAPDDVAEDVDEARRELAGWEEEGGSAPADAGATSRAQEDDSDDLQWDERESPTEFPASGDDSTDAPSPSVAPAPGPGRELRDIASATNPTFKVLRAVLAGRGVRKHGQALLSGMRPILEVVRDHPDRARAWITSGATPAPPGGAPPSLAWYRLAAPLFREVDRFGTGSPLLLLDVPPLETWSDSDWPLGCTLFVPFQDPENVGAVLRTAAAFGVPQVVLLQEAANPFHPKSARVAGSALLGVPILRGPSIRDLAPHGAPMYALSPGGRDVGRFEFPDRFGMVLGLEGQGLPEPWRSAEVLGIPMQPGSDSLNAAAATAIALYLWSQRRSRA